MKKWLESVYSDGTKYYVSNPHPKLFETVTVWLSVYEDAPIKQVFLRTLPNGSEHLIEAKRQKVERGLAYYAVELPINQNRVQYHFYLVCDEAIYFYTQKEITTYVPDHTYDFVLLADYVQPDWVKHAVFYHIFPERFCNGNPENDVKTDEYEINGNRAIQMPSWDATPLPYEEGHCMDFFGGDLEGIKEKIPYLKELGVTALYLNPIFTGPSVHKYDCVDYLHVDPHFGGDEALAKLSEALHENGMKLILDISINHTGADHKWFNRDCLFFDQSVGAYHNPDAEERHFYFFKEGTNEYLGWWNVADMPTLNYTSDKLRDAIYRRKDAVVRKWLQPPYSIDGWRFDVADVFARNNEIQLAHEIWPELRKAIREENPKAYILAEDWGDCAQYLQGNEWDSAMNYYGCGRVIRQFVGEPDAFMSRSESLRAVQYKMTAEDVKARIMEHLAKLPYAIWQNQFNLIDSHDISRLHNNTNVHQEEYRGAVMLLFTLIGAASIYYGDEAEIEGTVDHVNGMMSHIEGCRYPMPWHKDFKESKTYKLYQTMAQMKAKHEALSEGGMKFLYAKDYIVAIARFNKEEAFVTIVSTNNKEQKVQIPFASIGAIGPKGKQDVFEVPLNYQGQGDIELIVPPHQAYFIECEMK